MHLHSVGLFLGSDFERRRLEEKTKAGLRHAVVCPNVRGRTKKRIAQSKRARAGSLALVD